MILLSCQQRRRYLHENTLLLRHLELLLRHPSRLNQRPSREPVRLVTAEIALQVLHLSEHGRRKIGRRVLVRLRLRRLLWLLRAGRWSWHGGGGEGSAEQTLTDRRRPKQALFRQAPTDERLRGMWRAPVDGAEVLENREYPKDPKIPKSMYTTSRVMHSCVTCQ